MSYLARRFMVISACVACIALGLTLQSMTYALPFAFVGGLLLPLAILAIQARP